MKKHEEATPHPPRWAERLLERIAAPHLLEEVQGDLHELFLKRLQRYGSAKARLLLLIDLLTLLHPRLWRRKPAVSSHYTHNLYPDMFSHNLLLTYRSFLRFKGSFFINLVGLSTGLACTLLIYLWVNDELSVDKFHQKDERLYQVMYNVPLGDGAIQTAESTQGLLAKALAREMPEVEHAASAISWFPNKGILSTGGVRVKARELFVSEDYFHIFSCKVTQGNKNRVLSDKYSVAISDELANKLFGSTKDVIGKTVEWKQGEFSGPYSISGVFEMPPRNSSLQFDLLFSYDLFFDKHKTNLENWGNSNPSTYLVLKEGTNPEKFSAKIKDFSRDKFRAGNGPQNLEWVGTLFLQRYSDKYLYNHYENGAVAGGRIAYVKLFSTIALFILFIACINFMNLSTAKATRRIKEIGIKKAVGADRRSLILQFLSESMLMASLALTLAVGLVALLLPEFNRITGKQLQLDWSADVVLSVLAITSVTGLLAGSYPALYLSGFKPVTVLKGRLNTSVGETWARKGLVVFQFTISVILIVAVTVVYQQIRFIQTKNLGYTKDNIISFKKEGKLNEGLETFLAEVKDIPGVVNASSFAHNLTGNHGGTSSISWEGKNTAQGIEFGGLEVDYGLLELLGIQMTQGRTFSKKFSTDSSAILFNEAAIAMMGLKDPIGTTVTLWGKTYQIVGVTGNFHFESLYERVKPLFIRLIPNNGNVLVKIKAGQEKEVLSRLERFYKQFNGGLPFEYRFLDQDYQALYAAENRVAILSQYFAGVAILISCLGLLGLAAFTAERRKKEIGIRKVLGSSEVGIVYLLSNDFTRLVFAAIFIALPVSYLLAKAWLSSFAYRIELQPWYFLLAGLLALGTALLTVGLQALKAARVNPVQCLKDE